MKIALRGLGLKLQYVICILEYQMFHKLNLSVLQGLESDDEKKTKD